MSLAEILTLKIGATMVTRLAYGLIAIGVLLPVNAEGIHANGNNAPALHPLQVSNQKFFGTRVRMAEAPTEAHAFDIAKELNTVAGWEAFLKQHPSGYRADIARGYIDKLRNTNRSGPSPDGSNIRDAAPTSRPPQMVTPPVPPSVEIVNARVFNVGKWPERMAFDGQNIWVSESGQRQIAKINPYNGQILGRFSAGRLPVNILALPNGQVLSLAHTTNQIWHSDNQASQLVPGVIVPKCPDGMAYDNNLLWVLSKPSCSGDGATVLSVLRPAAQAIEPYNANIATGGQDIAASSGFVYIAHQLPNQTSIVTAIQPAIGRSTVISVENGDLYRIVTNQQAAYGAGRGLSQNGGLVVRVSGTEGLVTNRFEAPEFVQAITATPEYVIAASRNGTVWVLTADNLTLVRQFRIGNVSIVAHDVLIVDNALYITSFDDSGTNNNTNQIVVVDGWLGGGRVAPSTVRIQRPAAHRDFQPPVRSGAGTGVTVSCGNGYLSGGRCTCRKGSYRVKLGINSYTCRQAKKKKSKTRGSKCSSGARKICVRQRDACLRNAHEPEDRPQCRREYRWCINGCSH